MIDDDDFWVIKIAGGPHTQPSNGMMIVISTKTGEPVVLLQDNGYLTQLRTAVAGLISAKFLAPKTVSAIGIIGTGEQARIQLELLKNWTSCRDVYVWGRSPKKTAQYKQDMLKTGFRVQVAPDIVDITNKCNLIITTTCTPTPVVSALDIRPGTHITAIGADAPGKHELDPALFKKADIVVVDSKSQCIDHGDTHQAYSQGLIVEKDLIELGKIIANPSLGRAHQDQITITDLTGIAVQDIQIAKAVLGYNANN